MFRTQLCLAVWMVAALSVVTAGTAFAGPGGGATGDGVSATRADGVAALTITDPTRTNSGAVYTLFGASTDTIVFGDWNGDGNKSIGVFRDDNGGGLWILDLDGLGSLAYMLFGNGTDTPVVGDWDPNSVGDEIGVVRPQGAALRWILRDNTPNGCLCSDFTFGASTDLPAPGNWDGDANNGWEPGITRADGGAMLWITQGSGGLDYTLFGPSAGIPFPGDWDGDGNTDFGNRPTGGDGNVYILDNGGMLQYYQHGAPTDAGSDSGNYGQP